MGRDFDKTVLVYTPRDVQIKRVMQRDGLSKEEAEKRLKAQMPIDEKRRLSDYIIDAETTFAVMRHQVKAILYSLRDISIKQII
jgi:dephospho-CoA kinase